MYISKIETNQWVGIDTQPEEAHLLQAGDLSMEFQCGRIKNITFGGQVLLSEVYYALRDCNWGTIPYTISSISISKNTDSFAIDFKASHDSGNIKFDWSGKIEGTAGSSVSYTFDGFANSEFLKNRIGFCVLHHAACAGMKCRVEHSNGKVENGILPLEIAPHQPFFDISAITIFPPKGVGVKVSFEGDVFEMEDQRNWTDASFKTYCTPLSRPFPMNIKKGDRISQSLKIEILEDALSETDEVFEAQPIFSTQNEFERVGLNLGSCITHPLTQTQMKSVEELKLAHLRYDLHFCEQQQGLTEIIDQIELLNTKLLLAVFFTNNFLEEAGNMLTLLSNKKNTLCGILVFLQDAKVTPLGMLLQVRSVLGELKIPIGSGTDAFFTQLNREPLPSDAMDFVCYSNNPQVHAFDNQSIMSTTDGQYANVKSCKRIYPHIPCCVSPITLKMRWNPDAAAKVQTLKEQAAGEIEPRQMSLFAASWFLKSVATMLTGGNVWLATYFELVGKKGIMENEVITDNYPFPTSAGMLYPVYFVFWGLRDMQSGLVEATISEEVVKICVKHGDKTRVIVSNITDNPVKFELCDFPRKFQGLMLDEDNVEKFSQMASTPHVWQNFKTYNLNGDILLKRYSIFIAEI